MVDYFHGLGLGGNSTQDLTYQSVRATNQGRRLDGWYQ